MAQLEICVILIDNNGGVARGGPGVPVTPPPPLW